MLCSTQFREPPSLSPRPPHEIAQLQFLDAVWLCAIFIILFLLRASAPGPVVRFFFFARKGAHSRLSSFTPSLALVAASFVFTTGKLMG